MNLFACLTAAELVTLRGALARFGASRLLELLGVDAADLELVAAAGAPADLVAEVRGRLARLPW